MFNNLHYLFVINQPEVLKHQVHETNDRPTKTQAHKANAEKKKKKGSKHSVVNRKYKYSQLYEISKIYFAKLKQFTCKKGRRRSSSAKMQAAAQTSTPEPYCLVPNNSSGALYHRAKTYIIGTPRQQVQFPQLQEESRNIDMEENF